MASDFENSPTGNWNMSEDYIRFLFNLIQEASQYKEGAKFGTFNIIDDFQVTPENKNELRFKSLQRYIYKLKELIINSKFAVDETGKKKYDEYYKDLKMFEESLKLIRREVNDGDKKKFKMEEDLFKNVLDKLDDLDMEIREPMKRADLIFMHKEKFDAKEYKKKIKESFVEEG